jgi:anhydro-N-acetylmuramic acid kinase
MSGSSMDGLDLVFAELLEERGQWSFEIIAADCYPYSQDWITKLKAATTLNSLDYQLLHAEFGHHLGSEVNRFIEEKQLHFKVGLIASHGHTTFHLPAKKMTAQLGDGAALAAVTALPVVSDLRALDVAFGGQGAPIVPIGEKLLFPQYSLFLNIGGIANISFNNKGKYIAFDVCPANRVLNMLAALKGKEYDEQGTWAASGQVHQPLLEQMNALDYYQQSYPKSLANSFGTDEVFPLIRSYGLEVADALRTYVEHIVYQVKNAVQQQDTESEGRLLVTGGGAFNTFLVQRLQDELKKHRIEVVVPSEDIVKYKEALVMALIGVLRWRQEYNVLSSVTGAQRDSIGGAVWIGQEA